MTSDALRTILVNAVVVCCVVYAAWTLAPAGLKRLVADALMARSRYLRSSRRWQAWAQQKGDCGSCCSGCASTAARSANKTKPLQIRFIKRR